MDMKLPLPKDWQVFERICHRLWRDIWSDPSAQLHGRSGQAQHGVDVFGIDFYDQKNCGVQCKDKDGRLGSELTSAEFLEECIKARSFRPELASFVMATTGPRDAKLQQTANDFNNDSFSPFNVGVWSWNDIEEEIMWRPDMMKAYYSEIKEVVDECRPQLALSRTSPRDQIAAFFTRPTVKQVFTKGVQQRFIQVIHELSDNAFLHGASKTFRVSLADDVVCFEYDGVKFDPTTQLDPTKANTKSHLGSAVFARFRQSYEEYFEISYNYASENGAPTNLLQFKFRSDPSLISTPENLEFNIDYSQVGYGRRGAVRYAEKLVVPSDAKLVVLVFPRLPYFSGSTQVIFEVIKRLPPKCRLTVSLSKDDYDAFSEMELSFDDARVAVVPRC